MKKVRKFAEGGWSTSVSFNAEDAKRRAEQWAKDHPPKAAAKPAAKPAPAPKMEEVTVTAPRVDSKGPSRRFSAKNTPQPRGTAAINAKIADSTKKAVSGAGSAVSASLANRGSKSFGETVGAKLKSLPGRYKSWANANRNRSFGETLADSFAKGGTVRGDGCASKGKTKGRMR